jgi:hypothetical protein
MYCIVDVMISKILVGEDIEGSYQEEKMSKFLMKFRLQKNINQQIQKENYELRMQLQVREEEKHVDYLGWFSLMSTLEESLVVNSSSTKV